MPSIGVTGRDILEVGGSLDVDTGHSEAQSLAQEVAETFSKMQTYKAL
jgi:hypothetical protein